jgi:hypothetical protein
MFPYRKNGKNKLETCDSIVILIGLQCGIHAMGMCYVLVIIANFIIFIDLIS